MPEHQFSTVVKFPLRLFLCLLILDSVFIKIFRLMYPKLVVPPIDAGKFFVFKSKYTSCTTFPVLFRFMRVL